MTTWPGTRSTTESMMCEGGSCFQIGPEEFCRLAVSTRKLVRYDDRAAGMRGLEDQDTGERFFVDETELCEYGLAPASGR